jgi:hypothetical protein
MSAFGRKADIANSPRHAYEWGEGAVQFDGEDALSRPVGHNVSVPNYVFWIVLLRKRGRIQRSADMATPCPRQLAAAIDNGIDRFINGRLGGR